MVCRINASSGVLDIPAQRYFVERDGEEFRRFFASTLKLGHLIFDDIFGDTNVDPEGHVPDLVTTTSNETPPSQKAIRLITRPDLSAWVPQAVRNKVSHASELEFHDDIVYDGRSIEKPPYGLEISTRSPFLGEKRFRLQSRMEITPTPDGLGCIHTYRGHIEVHLLGFGGLVERMVRDSIQSTYRKLPDLIQKWNVKREEILKQHGGDDSIVLQGRPHGIDCGVSWIREYETKGQWEEMGGAEAIQLTPQESAEVGEAMQFALSVHSNDIDNMSSWYSKVIFSMWIGIVELCKLGFLVFVVLLLRLRFVRMTRSRSCHGSHTRRNSWANVIGHTRTGSESSSDVSMKDVDKLLQRAHVRRQSSLSSQGY